MAPDGRVYGAVDESKSEGQVNLAVMDMATGQVRALTHEADPQWRLERGRVDRRRQVADRQPQLRRRRHGRGVEGRRRQRQGDASCSASPT